MNKFDQVCMLLFLISTILLSITSTLATSLENSFAVPFLEGQDYWVINLPVLKKRLERQANNKDLVATAQQILGNRSNNQAIEKKPVIIIFDDLYQEFNNSSYKENLPLTLKQLFLFCQHKVKSLTQQIDATICPNKIKHFDQTICTHSVQDFIAKAGHTIILSSVDNDRRLFIDHNFIDQILKNPNFTTLAEDRHSFLIDNMCKDLFLITEAIDKYTEQCRNAKNKITLAQLFQHWKTGIHKINHHLQKLMDDPSSQINLDLDDDF